MRHTTHRQLIEAAVAILSDGQPRTASILSRVIRETWHLPHRADRMNDLMVAASGEGVVKLAPRLKGCRSLTWTLGEQPLPDWLFVRERPAPVVEPEPETHVPATLEILATALGRALVLLERIDAAMQGAALPTLDRTPRPLFDAARRNGH